jgi:hypothetical protein
MKLASIGGPEAGKIEIKLRQLSQLFNTLDPSPFRESDLALDTEDYIVGRAMELAADVTIDIIIYLPQGELLQASEADTACAIREYFELRRQAVSRELSETFKTGRHSLLVGLGILSVCILLGLLFAQRMDGPVRQILSESFLILGWVAIWKPSEIFLYAWPPIAARRSLFRRLSASTVTLASQPADRREFIPL